MFISNSVAKLFPWLEGSIIPVSVIRPRHCRRTKECCPVQEIKLELALCLQSLSLVAIIGGNRGLTRIPFSALRAASCLMCLTTGQGTKAAGKVIAAPLSIWCCNKTTSTSPKTLLYFLWPKSGDITAETTWFGH